MTHDAITAPEQLTLSRLRPIIARHWPEDADALQDVAIDGTASSTAWAGRVLLSYAPAARTAPSSLFLKICDCRDAPAHLAEIAFYTSDYATLPDAPLPRCHDHGQSGTRYHLLLQDLSDTHADNKDVPPSPAPVDGFADSIARLHAHHWGITKDSKAQFERFMAHVVTGLSPMLAQAGAALSEAERAFLQGFPAHYQAAMLARLDDPAGQCQIHGDANPTNLLSPITGDGTHYIIDRQPFDWSLQHGLAMIDLVTGSVPFWPIADRRAYDRRLIHRWCRAMAQAGHPYPQAQAEADFALCLGHGLCMAIEWCSNPTDCTGMQWLWQAQLTRSLAAMRDWGWFI